VHAAWADVDAGVAQAQAAASGSEVIGPVLRRLLEDAASGRGLDGVERRVLERSVIGIYENLYAAPVDDLSLPYADEPFRLPGADLTLLGGLDAVVDELAAGLDVRLGHRVERVARTEAGPHGAGWHVHSGTGDAALLADAVVVTIPVGALHAGRIAFDPPLPANVTAALGRIGAGVVTKVFFTFDAAFWAPRWSFSTVADPRPPFELWVDVSRLVGRPTLCAFATHHRAREIEALDEPSLLDLAAQTLVACRLPVP
jgi:monoamine oxidase